MVSAKHGARISIRDLVALNEASEFMAAAAEQVKRANPIWAPGVVTLLIQANNRVVALQARGAATFARHLEKHPAQRPQAEAEIAALAVTADPGQNTAEGEPEE